MYELNPRYHCILGGYLIFISVTLEYGLYCQICHDSYYISQMFVNDNSV